MTDDELVAALRERVDIDRAPQPAAVGELADLGATLHGQLPPLLTRIYREVGAGIGPETGLLVPRNAAELYTQWTDPERPLECEAWRWPPALVPILDWGCGSYSCVDTVDPDARVVRFEGDRFVPDDGATEEPTRPDAFAALFRIEAPSLGAWLERWLVGTLA